METFWFFRLRFRRTYDSAYDSDFRFSLGHKLSYDSDYDSGSDSVASENQPLEFRRSGIPAFHVLVQTLSLRVFIPLGATLESSLRVVWFSWTNQNSFAMHGNQWDCFICIDNRLRQMAFFVFVKVGGVRGKGQLSGHAERFWNKKAFLWKFVSLLYKTNRFHVAVRLFSNRSQKTSKCCKNISDTLGYRLLCTFLFLSHFNIICDLLLNRRTATWNLFVKLFQNFTRKNSSKYCFLRFAS